MPILLFLSLLILYLDLKAIVSKLCKTYNLNYEENTLKKFLNKSISRSPLSLEASFQRNILLKLLRSSKKFFSELNMEDRRSKLLKSSKDHHEKRSPILKRQQDLLFNLLHDIELTYLKKSEFFESLKLNQRKEDFYKIIFSISEKYDETSFHIDLAIMKPIQFYASLETLEFFLNLGWRSVLSLSKIGSHITFSSYLEDSYATLKWESDGVDFPENTLSYFNRQSQSIEKSALGFYDKLTHYNAKHINPVGILRLCAFQNSARKIKLKTKVQQSHKGFSIKVMFQT